MFGHLKAEDFINLMESGQESAVYRTHLDSCARCREVWESVQPLFAEVSSLDTEIPEPDWTEFRSSVRDQLLSRSVQRQTASSRWTGWATRPAMAWALSLLLAVGIPTGMFVWHLQSEHGPSTVRTLQSLPSAELIEAGTEKTVFDDVIELSDTEQMQFQELLEAAQSGAPRLQ
jgi:predicted anti-sigma-YlaC factor YlaD